MHEHFMRLALQEAEQALAEDEVPIGAVIVQQGTRDRVRLTTSASNCAIPRPTRR